MALELTETEKRVLEAARTGKVALLAGSRTDDPTTGNTPSVRAQALAEILSAPDLAPLGLRIAGATITGQLDIGERSVQWPVIIERCKFHELIVAKNARIPELAIVESQLPGLIAPYLHVTYALSLSGTRIGPGPV